MRLSVFSAKSMGIILGEKTSGVSLEYFGRTHAIHADDGRPAEHGLDGDEALGFGLGGKEEDVRRGVDGGKAIPCQIVHPNDLVLDAFGAEETLQRWLEGAFPHHEQMRGGLFPGYSDEGLGEKAEVLLLPDPPDIGEQGALAEAWGILRQAVA